MYNYVTFMDLEKAYDIVDRGIMVIVECLWIGR